MDIDYDIYETVLPNIGSSLLFRKKKINLARNEELDDILGESWSYRIINKNGDFAYVINGTVRYWIKVPPSINEFKFYGDKLIESALENHPVLVFTFVRGDGNWTTRTVFGKPHSDAFKKFIHIYIILPIKRRLISEFQ